MEFIGRVIWKKGIEWGIIKPGMHPSTFYGYKGQSNLIEGEEVIKSSLSFNTKNRFWFQFCSTFSLDIVR